MLWVLVRWRCHHSRLVGGVRYLRILSRVRDPAEKAGCNPSIIDRSEQAVALAAGVSMSMASGGSPTSTSWSTPAGGAARHRHFVNVDWSTTLAYRGSR
uniref:Uncharacterized protein n=1 Tax=Arundo donax TaxID=35708 RepID=A0A0A9GQT0_ARUDO